MTQQDVKNSDGELLDHRVIGNIRGNFFIPAYQRGYRWTRDDVRRLLDDVWESKELNRDYSLQPVVVKPVGGSEKPDGVAASEWELIDGQQRLTTLYLIFQFIKNKQWRTHSAPYTLRYETRPDSANYLKSLDPNLSKTNIDFFHLREAYEQVEEWFTLGLDEFAQEDRASDFLGHLTKKVKIIWYQVAAIPHLSEQERTSESIALFTRLNVGRIALTDAELIKAALLSAARTQPTDRSFEVAAQWDGIERDLHQADIWTFVSGLDAQTGYEKYPTRISLLLDTLADHKSKTNFDKRPRYHTFDTLRNQISPESFSDFWNRIVALHAQILGWYEDPRSFNKIGFLVACKVPFSEVVRMLEHPSKIKPTKSKFDAILIDSIRKHLDLTAESLDDESLRYDKSEGYRKLMRLLLLLNVETSTRSSQRFPFHRHVGQTWSLEHIHAQSAEILNKAEQWKTWLELQRLALDAVISKQNNEEITQITNAMDKAIAAIEATNTADFSGQKFSSLSTRVLKMLKAHDGPDHSIRNMALLSSGDNSSLSNSVFEVKRQMILALDSEGKYVPACTRNVFLKYYADADAQQPHYWSEKDKDSYLKAIRKILKPYFTHTAYNMGAAQ